MYRERERETERDVIWLIYTHIRMCKHTHTSRKIDSGDCVTGARSRWKDGIMYVHTHTCMLHAHTTIHRHTSRKIDSGDCVTGARSRWKMALCMYTHIHACYMLTQQYIDIPRVRLTQAIALRGHVAVGNGESADGAVLDLNVCVVCVCVCMCVCIYIYMCVCVYVDVRL